MSDCPTVKVKTKNAQGFFIMNEKDFDPAKHELFTGETYKLPLEEIAQKIFDPKVKLSGKKKPK